MLSKVNDIRNCEAKTKVQLGFLERIPEILKQLPQNNYERFFHDIVPAYGHAQAITFPDIPYLVWAYAYDYSDEYNGSYKIVEIDNKERFKRAFNGLRKYFENYLINHHQYLDSNLQFKNFDLLIDTLVLEGTDKAREAKWKSFLIEQGLFQKIELNLITYDSNKWLKEAFSNFDPRFFADWKVEGVQLVNNFINSSWYHFYLASKWYKKKFFQYCSEYQLVIPKYKSQRNFSNTAKSIPSGDSINSICLKPYLVYKDMAGLFFSPVDTNNFLIFLLVSSTNSNRLRAMPCLK